MKCPECGKGMDKTKGSFMKEEYTCDFDGVILEKNTQTGKTVYKTTGIAAIGATVLGVLSLLGGGDADGGIDT